MNRRRTIVYIASAFIVAIVFLSTYYFVKKPERAASNRPEEGQRVVVFRDVKYSGEKKGVIDWEIRAKLARKYIDKSVVEMEGIEGEYKPKPDTIVFFKGVKGEMDTEKEYGTVWERAEKRSARCARGVTALKETPNLYSQVGGLAIMGEGSPEIFLLGCSCRGTDAKIHAWAVQLCALGTTPSPPRGGLSNPLQCAASVRQTPCCLARTVVRRARH